MELTLSLPALPAPQVGSPEFTAVSLVFAAAAAVPPALLLRAASAQLYMRRRAAVVVAVRLAMAACIWSTHPLPEPPLRSCAAFSWNWPTNSHAITLLFVALGYPLPLG